MLKKMPQYQKELSMVSGIKKSPLVTILNRFSKLMIMYCGWSNL